MNPEQQIEKYITELKTYNEHTNIYSKKAYDKLNFHVEDCKQIATLAGNHEQQIIDMGSGSGLPSIILAIMNPKATITAIESKSRKTNFLNHVKDLLELNNLEVITDDINQVIRNQKPTANTITAKAFAPFDKADKLAEKMTHKGSRLIIPISNIQHEALKLLNLKSVSFDKHPSLDTFYLIKEY